MRINFKLLFALVLSMVLLAIVSVNSQENNELDLIEEKFFLGNEVQVQAQTNLTSTAPDYDMYVFSLQWCSSYCLKSQSKECVSKLNGLPIKHVVRIHGLWPSTTSKRFLPDCNSGSKISIKPNNLEVFERMKVLWPSFKGQDKDFWEHEYNKHGFCYTQKFNKSSYVPFFETAIELYDSLKLQYLIANSIPILPGKSSVFTYTQLYEAFKKQLGGTYFEITCLNLNNAQHFSEIRFFLVL